MVRRGGLRKIKIQMCTFIIGTPGPLIKGGWGGGGGEDLPKIESLRERGGTKFFARKGG